MRVALAVAAVFALLASDSAHAKANLTACTSEELNAYKPFKADPDAPGCDETSGFDTCTDDCLASYKRDAEHAPNCIDDSSYSSSEQTLREWAELSVHLCEVARANTTNKYFPQVVPGVSECDLDARHKFDLNKTYTRCGSLSYSRNCSDECLKAIEDKISSAPLCKATASHYTLGEKAKVYLVRCLVMRNEDLASNQVLNTVAGRATDAGKQSSSSMALFPAWAAVVWLVLAILSLN